MNPYIKPNPICPIHTNGKKVDINGLITENNVDSFTIDILT